MGRSANLKSRIKHPYNPDEVNIRLQHFRAFELVSMAEKGNLNLVDYNLTINTFSHDVFYRGETWDNVKKSQFIESLIIKLPVPSFYFDGSHKPWRIIDGLQRMFSIISFIRGDFKLINLEYLDESYNGLSFHEMPEFLSARLLNSELIAYVVNPGTPLEIKYNIFKRINTGGARLSGQEIRNAYFTGEPAMLLSTLAKNPLLKSMTGNKNQYSNISNDEYANRFVAFQLFAFKDYGGNMDLFLAEALQNLYEVAFETYNEIHEKFKTCLQRALDLLGKSAFYLHFQLEEDFNYTSPLNLFDTLTWNMGELSDWEYLRLLDNKDSLKDNLINMMRTDQDLNAGLSFLSETQLGVEIRFNKIQSFLKAHCNDY